MIHNEQTDYSVHFCWQKLPPFVSIKEMKGEIQPNATVPCEICIRSDTEPIEINNCISCLVWNDEVGIEWTVYCKLDCSILSDSQIRDLEEIDSLKLRIRKNVIQTDKPILTSSSLLSPKSQKQRGKMKTEAGEISVECCKSLISEALNSKIVQKQLDNLPPYKI